MFRLSSLLILASPLLAEDHHLPAWISGWKSDMPRYLVVYVREPGPKTWEADRFVLADLADSHWYVETIPLNSHRARALNVTKAPCFIALRSGVECGRTEETLPGTAARLVRAAYAAEYDRKSPDHNRKSPVPQFRFNEPCPECRRSWNP